MLFKSLYINKREKKFFASKHPKVRKEINQKEDIYKIQ